MKLQLVYCTHQTANLAHRERLAFPSSEVLARAFALWAERFPECDLVILSTCNRVELYHGGADAELPTPEEVAQFLAEFHGLPTEEVAPGLRSIQGEKVVEHLFEVVSSLDSMVLGEPQIVRQVRDAYRFADEFGACSGLLHGLFQGAIRVSGRVRSETRLAEGRVSIASVAVGDFAKSIFDQFHDKLVLVIGAGEMGEETLRYLIDEGVKNLIVINRSAERSERIAQQWGGRAADWSELDDWLGRADVIVSTTGAERPIVDVPRFRAARARHRGQTVFILDLGAPRDFDPAIGQLDEVFLYDIDSLQQTCDQNRKTRQREIRSARLIVEAETAAFGAEWRRRSGGETVTHLRAAWHSVSEAEVDRLFKRCPEMNERHREEVLRTFDRIVNKLLHQPLNALKEESRAGMTDELLRAMRRLFDLP